MKHILTFIAAGLLTLIGCSRSQPDASSPQTTNVSLALNWYPEAEHGGYVAADELKLFQSRKLNVDIIPGGPGAPNLVIQELAAGRIQFAISNADQVVIARSKGVPLVAVLAPLQSSPRCIMVHQSSGIETLQQLQNVELAISEARPFALWMKQQLPLTNVTMVPYNGLVGEFIAKQNFAQQGYVFSEPYVAKEKGSDPRALMLSEIGFNPYASLLVTTEDLIQSDPDLVRQVVQASREGWEKYLHDPTATNARLHKDNPDMSLEALAYAGDTLQPLCQAADGEVMYSMTAARWQQLIDQIQQVKVIEPGSVSAEECFTTQFLP
jgi:NitT/TauT family transport system substrate-binding protein